MKRVIIVLGMHRSGTSLVAQICRCVGGYLGEQNELLAATSANPDGFFENRDIVNINDNILDFCNKKWYSIERSELKFHSRQIVRTVGNLELILGKLLRKSDTVVIKDPRIAMLLPLWKRVLEKLGVNVDYIWVFRNPLEVAESLMRRDGYSRDHGLLLWLQYNIRILEFLKGKEYLLLHYREILEEQQVFEQISRFFGQKLDEHLKWELSHILKYEYCHSNYSYQDVINTKNKLLSDLYGVLLNRKDIKGGTDWGRRYAEDIPKVEGRYIDYEVLENIKCLEKRKIVIYGAGNCGEQAAKMLYELNFLKFDFCDRDAAKHGSFFMKRRVFSIAEIEDMSDFLVIIAVKDKQARKEIEQTLMCMKQVRFLSFFALEAVWKYFIKDYTTMMSYAESFSFWHGKLNLRWNAVRNACEYPIIVYQGGKVGSTTVTKSLKNAGLKVAQIHNFFYHTDIVGELALGTELEDFVRSFNYFHFRLPEYVKHIKNEMKNKLVITMVRDPLAVDLSLVFQWLGDNVADRYFSKRLKRGEDFTWVVSELMLRARDHMFNWFGEELQGMYGINVLEYPFDMEKGYAVISNDTVKILVLKSERLSQLTEIIKDFVGNYQIELSNENVGSDKEYSHIYREIKERLKLPKEYVEHYYKNNSFMNHFYSREEQEGFWNKWKKCIREEFDK